MDTLGLSTQYKVRHCSQCQGDTEFYCHTCKHDLCLLCKERHVMDLHTKHHDVVIYREKFNYIPRHEFCVRHPHRIYEMFCQSCELSVCFRCLEHRKHHILDIRTAYETKRQQHREIIDNIRSETLYNCRVLLAGIQTDIQTCPPQICHSQSQLMSTKAQRLKDLIDTVVCDVTRYRGLLIARIQQQKRKMNRRLTHLQNYEDRYEQSANRVLQFLLFIKTRRVPQIKDSSSQLLSVITEIQMSTGNRQVGINECVKLTSTAVLHASVCVTDVSGVYHISGVTSDRVWVCDITNLILTDTTGDTIHRVTDIAPLHRGLHTVNSSGELIYIDSNYNINKLSIDSKTVTTLLERPTSQWIPRSVYCSPSTGDLLVAMYNTGTNTGKITRYNSTGQQVLTIQHNNTGHNLYSDPYYITENRNGDIIVSDYWRAVVVTERGWRHRFSYTGPPSGSSLWPYGICTDALSHILVCDRITSTVQMIDKDGHFLSLLLAEQHGIEYPWSLNYDDKTHLLWVGSGYSNTVCVYRYIQRRYSLTEENLATESKSTEQQALQEKDPNFEIIKKSNLNPLAKEFVMPQGKGRDQQVLTPPQRPKAQSPVDPGIMQQISQPMPHHFMQQIAHRRPHQFMEQISQPMPHQFMEQISQPMPHQFMEQISQPMRHQFMQQISQPMPHQFMQQISQSMPHQFMEQISQPMRHQFMEQIPQPMPHQSMPTYTVMPPTVINQATQPGSQQNYKAVKRGGNV